MHTLTNLLNKIFFCQGGDHGKNHVDHDHGKSDDQADGVHRAGGNEQKQHHGGEGQSNEILDHGRALDVAGEIPEQSLQAERHAVKVENADEAAQQNAQVKFCRRENDGGDEENRQNNPVGQFKFFLERVFGDEVHVLNS